MAGKPWERYGQQGGVFTLPPDPQKQREQQRQDAEAARAAAREARAAAEWNATHNPDGTPKTPDKPFLSPDQMRVTGPAFLKTLTPADQAQVQALAEGRMAFPTGKAATSDYWQQRIQWVSQYDPTFDATNYNARSKLAASARGGELGNNIRSLNTAIGHVGLLASQIDGTASHGGFPLATTLNAAENWWNRERGESGITNYDQTAGSVASELTRVFRGTGGAEADVQRELNTLNSNGSRQQKASAVRNLLDLLNSRLDAINNQYTAGMGPNAKPLNILDDHAKHVIGLYAPDLLGGGNGPGGSSGPGGGSPPNTPTPGLYDANGRFIGVDPRQAGANADGTWRDAQGQLHAPDGSIILEGEVHGGPGYEDSNKPNPYEQYLKQKAAIAERSDKPNSFDSYLSRAGDGVLQNYSDELAGLVGGAKSLIQGNGFDQGYGLARDIERMAQHQREQGQGSAGTAVDVLSSLPVAALLPEARAGTLGGVAKTGAYLGAINGFGQGNGLQGSLESGVGGAVGGALGGAGGYGLGKYAVAPLARRLSNTSGGQAMADALSRLTGRQIQPVPNPTPFESAMGKTGIDPYAVRGRLQTASDLNVPYALADADPRLQMLAGKVSRTTPDARAIAENYLEPRGRAQVDRFQQAVTDNLASPVDVNARANELKGLASSQSAPLYEQAFQNNQVSWSPRIQQFLDDPLSRAGLAKSLETQRLEALARGEPFDPSKFSVTGFDESGVPILSKTPNLRTVDGIRRGYGEILDSLPRDAAGNPIYTQRDRAIAQAKDSLTNELDNMTKLAGNNAYSDARDTYGTFMGMRDALNNGFKQEGNQTPARDVQTLLGSLKPNELPEYQSGYATSLVDRANRQRLTANPWTAQYGTPNQQALIGSVFPEGAPRFAQHYGLENDMAKTAQEVLGGSQTAARQGIDAAIGNSMLEHTANIGGQAMTGVPAMGTAAKQGIGWATRFGIGQAARQNADRLAPVLFNDADKIDAIGLLNAMMANNALRNQAAQSIGSKVGLFGALLSANRN